MLCKDCKYLNKFQNSDECQIGICSFPQMYVQVELDKECVFIPKPYTCKDCDRFGNDTACMTAQADDSIYRKNGDPCPGFVDKLEVNFINILTEWKLRGSYSLSKIDSLIEEWEKDFRNPLD